jgi:Xaa-Pro aminopeptidase
MLCFLQKCTETRQRLQLDKGYQPIARLQEAAAQADAFHQTLRTELHAATTAAAIAANEIDAAAAGGVDGGGAGNSVALAGHNAADSLVSYSETWLQVGMRLLGNIRAKLFRAVAVRKTRKVNNEIENYTELAGA